MVSGRRYDSLSRRVSGQSGARQQRNSKTGGQSLKRRRNADNFSRRRARIFRRQDARIQKRRDKNRDAGKRSDPARHDSRRKQNLGAGYESSASRQSRYFLSSGNGNSPRPRRPRAD